ncbi:hypothetical protein BAE44_0012772, partial [Dichanthelium oligosanthes]
LYACEDNIYNGGQRGDGGADHPRHHPPAARRLPQARHQDRVLDLPHPVLLRLPAGDHLRRLGHRQVVTTRIYRPGSIITVSDRSREPSKNSDPCATA